MLLDLIEPHVSPTAARVLRSLSARAKTLIETSSSFSWRFFFVFWCSGERSQRTPARSSAPGHGAAAPELYLVAGRRQCPAGVCGRLDRRSKASNRRYPFGKNSIKSPWKFCFLLRGPWRLRQISFSNFENVFLAGLSKIRFQILQFCHRFYNAHKIFVLTSFLSIQIPLDLYLHALHVRNISLLV